jgi:hypothetical protein
MSSPNQLSFLPDDYLERKQRRRTNVICALLFVTVLAAISSAFLITERSVRVVMKNQDDVKQQYEDAAKRLLQVQEMQEKQKRMAHQAELTASLIEKAPRSFVLAEVTNSLPAGVSLIDLSLDSKLREATQAAAAKTIYEQKLQEMEAKKKAVADFTAVKRYDVNIRLTGVAATDVQVAQFINRLARSKLLRDVNLVIVDEFKIDKQNFRKFQLEMMLNPDADVQSYSATNQPVNTAAVPIEAK